MVVSAQGPRTVMVHSGYSVCLLAKETLPLYHPGMGSTPRAGIQPPGVPCVSSFFGDSDTSDPYPMVVALPGIEVGDSP